MAESPTLLVLAAGMGSRYGGLKQLDPMGPAGETVLDYSIHDALRAGFGRVVFVIRRDIEQAFRETIGRRYAGRIAIDYAFQAIDDLPAGYTVPAGRAKPWGTGHAVRAARGLVRGPFAVINADDFYGAAAYRVLAGRFTAPPASPGLPLWMVGYPLERTLSGHGSVNRGICASRAGLLQSVREVTGIRRHEDGLIRGTGDDGRVLVLDPQALVSMNFWGFTDAVFAPLEAAFGDFLFRDGQTDKSEFYLPAFIDSLIVSGSAQCELLPSDDDWFGVTYPEDKPAVQARLRERVAAGAYPCPLEA